MSTSNTTALMHRINRMIEHHEKSVTHAFILLGSAEIPAERRAQIKPHDTVYIKRIALA